MSACNVFAEAPLMNQCALLTAGPSTMAHQLAAECMCPISQALMIDPVIAADGHTYDRAQIEKWFQQQKADGRVPPTSPQTREPLTDKRLVSNMALRRTIEHLVESGCLDFPTVKEWREAKEVARKSAINPSRARALKRAPLGTAVTVNVLLALREESEAETECMPGSMPLSDLKVDVHVSNRTSGGGGGFGMFGNPTLTQGRLLIPNLALGAAVRSLETDERSTDSAEAIKSIIQCPPKISSGTMEEEVLLAAVFPQQLANGHSSHSLCGDANACITETCLAVEHIVRRLASIECALPQAVQAEWKILDKELQIRRRQTKFSSLRRLLSRTCFRATTVVHAVDDHGCFTLAFPCLKASSEITASDGIGAVPTTQVPTDFIGQGGVIVDSSRHRQQPAGSSLFGAAPANHLVHGGLFGRTPLARSVSAASLNDAEPTPGAAVSGDARTRSERVNTFLGTSSDAGASDDSDL
jgi:hypothetical protein